MRIHVVGLAHTQTTREYESCAFTSNAIGFCRMMKSLGHEVILYASEDNDAPCDELVTCITKEEQSRFAGVNGPEDMLKAPYDRSSAYWTVFNARVGRNLALNAQPGDIAAITTGHSDVAVVGVPGLHVVEYTAGYEGVMRTGSHRVFPSYAWQASIFTYENGGRSQSAVGRGTDTVIPHYFNMLDFPYSEEKDDYLLFVGRLNADKGLAWAVEAARKTGRTLVIAGPGTPPTEEFVDYRGLLGIEERGKLMSRAHALLAPTLYLEPFGKVVVEGMLTGTPVITTDWGAFPEIVVHGEDGWRCRSVDDMVEGIDHHYAPWDIRDRAEERFGEEAIGPKYEAFLEGIRGE